MNIDPTFELATIRHQANDVESLATFLFGTHAGTAREDLASLRIRRALILCMQELVAAAIQLKPSSGPHVCRRGFYYCATCGLCWPSGSPCIWQPQDIAAKLAEVDALIAALPTS